MFEYLAVVVAAIVALRIIKSLYPRRYGFESARVGVNAMILGSLFLITDFKWQDELVQWTPVPQVIAGVGLLLLFVVCPGMFGVALVQFHHGSKREHVRRFLDEEFTRLARKPGEEPDAY